MNEIRLGACPFCGGKVVILEQESVNFLVDFTQKTLFKCLKCGMEFEYTYNRYQNEKFTYQKPPVELFNTRVPVKFHEDENMKKIMEQLEELSKDSRQNWNEYNDEVSFGQMNAYNHVLKMLRKVGGK